MNELTLHLPAAEHAELADLADATGRTPQEYVLALVRDRMAAEREAVAGHARRLAERHAALLERLGA
ncbi:hypothetical protein [Streptomyces sp. NPDC090112]|uniref:hypothetical protein n=1 Tax=Streptomyces sp. NPDC090112 TaxID=3365949 RepID=UPI0037F41A50